MKTMKTMKTIFFKIFIFIGITVQAQFQEHIIESIPNTVNSIISTDIDNDNDVDIIVSGGGYNQLKWFENTDGLGDFNIIHIIRDENFQENFWDIAISDINGDNDIDILVSTSETDYGTATTFENTDGLGNFEYFSTSMAGTGYLTTIAVADIDGDNDNDWVSSKSNYPSNKISWFENDGLGNVTEHIIDDVFHSYVSSIQVVDIDNDGDVDIVGFVSFNGQLLWYENTDGLGNFERHYIIINSNLNNNSKLIAKDLNNNGDIDIIIAYNNILSWYKNDGEGNFGSEIIINNDNNTKMNILVIDLDSDGFMDIISTGDDNSIYFYENEGQGNFGSEIIIDNLHRTNSPLFAIDVNGNNKIDLISSSSENGKIAWYENTWELSVNENDVTNFLIYPNPSKDFIQVKSKVVISQVNIYNEIGVLVLTELNNNYIDISTLSNGVYFMEICDVDGYTGFEKLIKK
jgi:hypothetical protein